MSYIPPLVCDTPPPIDFEDSNEDDFGDGMFSNYDGSSLPTTPKQLSSAVDPDDLPLDIPELPEVPHFPHMIKDELVSDTLFKDSLKLNDLPSTSSSNLQSNHIYFNDEPPQLEPIIDNDANKIPKLGSAEATSVQPDLQLKDLSKNPMKLQSSDNSSESQSNSNDIMCRSESPPSLVFSAESLNCDDNQLEDYEEFQQSTDDVECNLPSLKLDSISDTKSQSSDLEETNMSVECETDEVRKNSDIRNATSNTSKLNVDFETNVDTAITNVDDSFDDFVEYESNVIESEKIDLVNSGGKLHQEEFTQRETFKDENVFAADFSQFEAFSENTDDRIRYIDCPQEPRETTLDQLHTDSIPTDTADDFNDFGTADDDDEFGEFNDFSDFSQSQTFATSLTTNIVELSAKIKPLLDSLFPNSDNDSEDGSFDALDLTNDTTSIIKDFENSKALDHNWTSSVGKRTLVTALGIDSRNILYGGKWNSSMPRFAANLGFSPLEPIKPSSVSGASSNSSVSNEIPAAQFDWNSSGLTNPLDASHAHTLLLDLEQLVVVANLDKIKLDSSTCSSTIPVTSNRTNNNSMSSPNNHYIHNCNADGIGYQYGDFYGNSLPYSFETNIKTLDKNTNHFGLFDQFLDIRVQEILHKTNTTENQSSRVELDWHSTKAEPTLITPSVTSANIHTSLNNAIDFIDADEHSQTSSSYVIPGSGSLKETHIFTPSKSPYSIPQSRDVQNDKQELKCPDFDYEKAAAGIIIDENVVKKEYRDLEYDPDKPTGSTLNSINDFSDFQSVPMPTTPHASRLPQQHILSMDFGILQPTKRHDNITINWPDPGNVITSTNMESFDSFNFVENVKGSTSSDIGLNEKSNSSSSSFGEFAKPVIGVSPSDIMFERNSVSLEDEFSDFQSVEPIATQNQCADVIPNFQSPHDVTPSNPIELSNKIIDSNLITKSESMSTNLKNWTDYQSSRDAPITTNVPLTNILQPSPLKPLQILTPQPVNPQPSLQTKSIWPESEIDPDEIARLEAIFPQAQKQSQRSNFDTPTQNPNSSKPQEDDEWSDFVSVATTAPQSLPITNIISENILKHQQDDDEWSDFVSSTTQPSMQQWNVGAGPNFTSWNAPPQFDSWQSATLFQQPQHIVPAMSVATNNNPTMISNQTTRTNPNSFFAQKTPSISLIPDLSFAAPKTLVNRSRTNYQSK